MISPLQRKCFLVRYSYLRQTYSTLASNQSQILSGDDAPESSTPPPSGDLFAQFSHRVANDPRGVIAELTEYLKYASSGTLPSPFHSRGLCGCELRTLTPICFFLIAGRALIQLMALCSVQ
jgi:hypothetical protein